MAIETSDYHLFKQQVAALNSPAQQLLVGGDETGAGCSHLLRIAAIIHCARFADLKVHLVQRNLADVTKNHINGPRGLRALLTLAQQFESVRMLDGEIRFRNGAVITWGGCYRDVEVAAICSRRIDVLFVDDAHDIPQAVFERLRDHVLSGASKTQRIVASSSQVSSSWVGEYWRAQNGSSAFVEMTADGIDPDLRVESQKVRLVSHINEVLPSYCWMPHNELMVGQAQRLLDQEIDNLAFFIPPQHGKTLLGTLISSCYLRLNATSWVGFASYGATKANRHSYEARDYYQRAGGELRHGAGAVHWWENNYGGGMWSAGTAAKQAGRPLSLGVIDDGDADREDATSASQQEKKRSWYLGTWRARESMFGARALQQLLIATRWDPEDLAAFVIQKAALKGEKWTVVLLPALYDPDVRRQFTDPQVIGDLYPHQPELAYSIPENFTLVDDYRTIPGTPLIPEEFKDIYPAVRDKVQWESFFDMVGQDVADAEFQQNPQPLAGGGKFRRTWFNIINQEDLPSAKGILVSSRGWDDGATEDGGDSTVGTLMHKLKPGFEWNGIEYADAIVIADMVEEKLEGSAVKALKVQTAIQDGKNVVVATPQDPGGSGKTDFIETERRLTEEAKVRKVINDRPDKKKTVRWRPLSSLARPREVVQDDGTREQRPGRVFVVRGPGGMVGHGNVPLARFLTQMHNSRGTDIEENDITDSCATALVGCAEPVKRLQVF